MIVTECPYCDGQKLFNTPPGSFGVCVLHTCIECENEYVVEVTRLDGVTYAKDEFEREILPMNPDYERVEHPDGDVTLYCDPDKLTWVDE